MILSGGVNEILICFFSSFLFLSSLFFSKKKQKKMDDEEDNENLDDEEEYPNKETEKLFDSVKNGDEEFVKVLLLPGNKNKQFKLDINFQFKYKKIFFSFLFSLSSFFCCSAVMLILNGCV